MKFMQIFRTHLEGGGLCSIISNCCQLDQQVQIGLGGLKRWLTVVLPRCLTLQMISKMHELVLENCLLEEWELIKFKDIIWMGNHILSRKWVLKYDLIGLLECKFLTNIWVIFKNSTPYRWDDHDPPSVFQRQNMLNLPHQAKQR